MRNTMLTLLTLSAAAAAAVTGVTPVAAYDYPWCAQGRGPGYPGQCDFQTYAQCEASASGRGLYCNINPRVAFAVAPQPYYHHHRYHH